MPAAPRSSRRRLLVLNGLAALAGCGEDPAPGRPSVNPHDGAAGADGADDVGLGRLGHRPGPARASAPARSGTFEPVGGRTVAGFSDGASYALTLGLANGDVFDSVITLSPGFEAAQVRRGRPCVFVTHGTGDRVLPIDRCSRRLVPALERAGHDVTYREFDGGHEVPPDVRRAQTGWLAGG